MEGAMTDKTTETSERTETILTKPEELKAMLARVQIRAREWQDVADAIEQTLTLHDEQRRLREQVQRDKIDSNRFRAEIEARAKEMGELREERNRLEKALPDLRRQVRALQDEIAGLRVGR
jgi:chromosome segregation ATPase